MKKLFFVTSVLFFSIQSIIIAQNSITDCDYIPLVSYLYGLTDWYEDPRFTESEFRKIELLGFHSVEINDLTESQYTRDQLGNYNFNIIPDQVNESVVGAGRNLINKYTEAKYTVWQAEGTPPDDGEATLVRNIDYTDKNENNTFIMTKAQYIPEDTELLKGPQIWQDATYNMVEPGIVDYKADFCLKVEELIPSMNLPTDPVCNLQITTTRIKSINGVWTSEYIVVADSAILFEDFTSLNQWKHFYVDYDLTGLPDSFYNDIDKSISSPNWGWDDSKRNLVRNMEYKIIWKGNAETVRLSVDSITIYDQRGDELTNPNIWPITRGLIENMIQYNYNYQTKISGWFGVDEPQCIDNFEPIRIINELLESQSGGAKLWISCVGSWSGSWGLPGHPYSAGERIRRVDEFFKRVKRANVLQNIPPLESPWTWEQNPPRDPRLMNIDLVADSFYARYNLYTGAHWGSGILTGSVPILD